MKLVVTLSLFLLFVVGLTFAQTSPSSPLQTLLKQKEDLVTDLANKGQTYFRNRCSHIADCTSRSCSTAACGCEFPTDDYTCSTKWGSDPNTCDGSDSKTVALNKTVIRAPLSYDDDAISEFVCYSTYLENDFIAATSGLDKWQYVGSESGGFRMYPGVPQSRANGQCSDYDPRRRPWYVAAAGGPKDVVVIFERSKYMSSTWGETRTALKELLGSFTPNDFVSVIGYNEEPVELLAGTAEGKMLRATRGVISSLVESLDELQATGDGFDDRQALDLGFARLNASHGQSSGCPKIIILVTEGLTQSTETNARIAAGQQMMQALGSKAHIFGLSIFANSGGDLDSYLQAVTCDNEGVWAQVRGDPIEKLQPYFDFLSIGISQQRVAWTAPYTDAFGLGEMVTVAVPYFDTSRNPAVVVGVAGSDILMSELEALVGSQGSANETTEAVLQELIARGATCPTFNVDECSLQLIRETTGFVCPNQATVSTCKVQREVYTPRCTDKTSLSSALCGTGINAAGDNTVQCCSSSSIVCGSGAGQAAIPSVFFWAATILLIAVVGQLTY